MRLPRAFSKNLKRVLNAPSARHQPGPP